MSAQTIARVAGHPFRHSLPASVFEPLPELEPEVRAAMERRMLEGLEDIGAGPILLRRHPACASAEEAALILPATPPAPIETRRWLVTPGEVRQFLLAYAACFAAVSVFIS